MMNVVRPRRTASSARLILASVSVSSALVASSRMRIGAPVDARDYELAAKILKHMDCAQVRLLTNNPLKVAALEGHGINVFEQVPHVVTPSRYNARYLATKRERMAHKL